MLKEHFGKIVNPKESLVKKENQIKKKIYDQISTHMISAYGSNIQFVTYNPFLAAIHVKISFVYFKIYASKF